MGHRINNCRRICTAEEWINHHLPFLTFLGGRELISLLLPFLGPEWESVVQSFVQSTWQLTVAVKQSVWLHSLTGTGMQPALSFPPVLALAYSLLLEVVLTSWRTTGMLQSECKCRDKMMWTRLHRIWISYLNELLDLLLYGDIY